MNFFVDNLAFEVFLRVVCGISALFFYGIISNGDGHFWEGQCLVTFQSFDVEFCENVLLCWKVCIFLFNSFSCLLCFDLQLYSKLLQNYSIKYVKGPRIERMN